MKVLHVAESIRGGVGSYLDELIPLQRAALGSINIRAIVPAEHRSQLQSVADDALIPFERGSRSFATLSALRGALRQAIDDMAPDIVHLHSSIAGLVGRLPGSSGNGHRLLYSPHGWAFEMWPAGVRRGGAAFIERRLARRCARIVAVSEAERQQGMAAGIPGDRIAVVLNGIASTPKPVDVAPWADRCMRLLFVGRLDPQKGYDTLTAIAARNPDRMCVRVIGESVVVKPSEVSATPNIEHLGWLTRSQVDAQLHACDLVVMPSRWEAFGLAAVEAMRAGKPVVAFAVGGLPEVVEHGVTGRLVAPGDVAAFERALLADTPSALARMGAAGRRRFEQRFMATRMADELFALYRAELGT